MCLLIIKKRRKIIENISYNKIKFGSYFRANILKIGQTYRMSLFHEACNH